MVLNYYNAVLVRSLGPVFGTFQISTNGTTATVLFDKRTQKPIWTQWDLHGNGSADVVSYFFQGTNVPNLHLNLKRGTGIGYDVIFYGPGKSQT